MGLSKSEITSILQERISNYHSKLEKNEVGRVISFADGIARVYGK
jgi:F-type H+-transporting ATPase subunit alpha